MTKKRPKVNCDNGNSSATKKRRGEHNINDIPEQKEKKTRQKWSKFQQLNASNPENNLHCDQVRSGISGINNNYPSKSNIFSSDNPASNRNHRIVLSAPSVEALELSAKLKHLSQRKQLKESLALYWDPANDSIRDSHHASIIIDSCSRCGAVEEGEKIMFGLMKYETKISVQANTALLKGYAHSGMIEKGVELYKRMCLLKEKRSHPNIRTFNTLLRACLWSAVSIKEECKKKHNDTPVKRKSKTSTSSNTKKSKDNDSISNLIGGVLSCEEAWLLSRKICFDTSSFEYSVQLLCYALRVRDAEEKIKHMKDHIGSSLQTECAESLCICYVALSRAYALLGNQTKAQEKAESALELIRSGSGGRFVPEIGATKNPDDVSSKIAIGGKRGWKKNLSGEVENNNSIKSTSPSNHTGGRSASNTVFRNHRMLELKREAETISSLCQRKMLLSMDDSILPKLLYSRLLYFSGGGTTDFNAVKKKIGEKATEIKKKQEVRCLRDSLLQSSWHSFGLSCAVLREEYTDFSKSKCDILALHSVTGEESLENSVAIQNDGFIDFSEVFRPLWDGQLKEKGWDCESDGSGNRERPIYVELGAGDGDWVVQQASVNRSIDYAAVELRADRVAKIFSKICLHYQPIDKMSSNVKVDRNKVPCKPLSNVCCIGSECGSFLRKHVKNKTITRIFVNHPEPPTQTYDMNLALNSSSSDMSEEPAHMLNSETILSTVMCLKPLGNGQLIIVTDNLWYAKLICSTIVKVMAQHRGLIEQVPLNVNCLRPFQTFLVDKASQSSPNGGNIVLYIGQPCDAIGHVSLGSGAKNGAGASYFDRLWRAGGGKHANAKDRYVIIVKTAGGNVGSGLLPQEKVDTAQNSSYHNHFKAPMGTANKKGSSNHHKKNGKKKSAEKQARRNERRMEKRKLLDEKQT
mmetsp:Transcript_56869/g.68427  ORF Transcript_56869/g.68427 Transcript_56869/m.68427 type:complete len:920 (+) Transcript_56869:77-2836(+)